jgi:uncharacterized protein YndB with AHSA1/START domain
MNRHRSATVELPSDREIVITRKFDAPSHLVFEAWTTPDYVRRWWGSDESPLVVCDIDLQVGGDWRYVSRIDDATELAWHGTYREIAPGDRLVSTEVFEGFPDAEAVDTLTLTEKAGVTTLSVNVLHSSKENRDGHINSGMEEGMQHVLDRLEDLVVRSDSHAANAAGNVRREP